MKRIQSQPQQASANLSDADIRTADRDQHRADPMAQAPQPTQPTQPTQPRQPRQPTHPGGAPKAPPKSQPGSGATGQVVAASNWVSLRYRLHDSQGEAIEEQSRQLVYLHGAQAELFPKIEQALEGLRPGARISLYLEPQDSFGDYDAARVYLVDRRSLPADLEEGMAFEGLPGRVLGANTAPTAPDAAHDLIYTVTDLSADVAVLDGNHPLAGMSLRFDIEVMEIWEATPDEIEQALTAPQA